jgi:hypothetical protein
VGTLQHAANLLYNYRGLTTPVVIPKTMVSAKTTDAAYEILGEAPPTSEENPALFKNLENSALGISS